MKFVTHLVFARIWNKKSLFGFVFLFLYTEYFPLGMYTYKLVLSIGYVCLVIYRILVAAVHDILAGLIGYVIGIVIVFILGYAIIPSKHKKMLNPETIIITDIQTGNANPENSSHLDDNGASGA